MQSIKIFNKEYELYCSTAATSEIAEKCGGISKLRNWLVCDDLPGIEGEKDTSMIIVRIADIIAILINGAINKNNYAINAGLTEGEKLNNIDAETIKAVLTAGEIINSRDKIFMAIAEGMNFEIPDGVNIKAKKVDKVLEEIRENRAKKEESAE